MCWCVFLNVHVRIPQVTIEHQSLPVQQPGCGPSLLCTKDFKENLCNGQCLLCRLLQLTSFLSLTNVN